MARKKSKHSYREVSIYAVGILVLLVVIALYASRGRDDSWLDDFRVYLNGQPSVVDAIGSIQDIQIVSTHVQGDQSLDQRLLIKGERGQGHMTVHVFNANGRWSWSNIEWVLPGKGSQRLPRFTLLATAVHAGSLTSSPLKEPRFFTGEVALFHFTLGFVPVDQHGTHIVQSLEIRDEQGAVIAQNENVSTFQSSRPVEQINFDNEISSLSPGKYTAEFIFSNRLLEGEKLVYPLPFLVTQAKEILLVHSVNWFDDKSRQKKNRDATFVAGQPIYLEIELSGFAPEKDNVSGTVDLEIRDDRDNLIAKKQKFAAFNQPFIKGKSIVVPGELGIQDAGLYYIHFKITDHQSHRQIVHQEKLLVQLSSVSGQ